MIKITKNNGFFLFVLGFLTILNLALILKIPLILQIIGIVALCFVPGYFLCLLFNIIVSDRYENFLYAMGVSIIFDIFFGVGMNSILPIFGENAPLTPINIQICYSVTILLLSL